MQKTVGKNTKYSRNKTILKIGYLAKAIVHAKAIAFEKMVSLGQKHAENDCTRRLELFCAKKPLEKTLNIREMRRFLKSAILQRL